MIHKNGRHLEFGTGDIGIHMGDTSDVAFLVFKNLNKPVPIGRFVSTMKAKKVSFLDTDVVMSFSNSESIDALIKCLQHVRRRAFE